MMRFLGMGHFKKNVDSAEIAPLTDLLVGEAMKSTQCWAELQYPRLNGTFMEKIHVRLHVLIKKYDSESAVTGADGQSGVQHDSPCLQCVRSCVWVCANG